MENIDQIKEVFNEIILDDDFYGIAYPMATIFIENADNKFQSIVNMLSTDEWEVLRDRFANFSIDVIKHYFKNANNIYENQLHHNSSINKTEILALMEIYYKYKTLKLENEC